MNREHQNTNQNTMTDLHCTDIYGRHYPIDMEKVRRKLASLPAKGETIREVAEAAAIEKASNEARMTPLVVDALWHTQWYCEPIDGRKRAWSREYREESMENFYYMGAAVARYHSPKIPSKCPGIRFH